MEKNLNTIEHNRFVCFIALLSLFFDISTGLLLCLNTFLGTS